MKNKNTQDAYFAAGCFWGVQETFDRVKGVVETEVGYAGGHTQHPSYKEVCGGATGHAETVHVVFDPSVVLFQDLLRVFWDVHDPTQVNRQGPDVGEQYRSVIFTVSDEQLKEAQESKEAESKKHSEPIATAIEPFSNFFRAEEYHQHYLQKNKDVVCNI